MTSEDVTAGLVIPDDGTEMPAGHLTHRSSGQDPFREVHATEARSSSHDTWTPGLTVIDLLPEILQMAREEEKRRGGIFQVAVVPARIGFRATDIN